MLEPESVTIPLDEYVEVYSAYRAALVHKAAADAEADRRRVDLLVLVEKADVATIHGDPVLKVIHVQQGEPTLNARKLRKRYPDIYAAMLDGPARRAYTRLQFLDAEQDAE